jgi:hypothetical protein
MERKMAFILFLTALYLPSAWADRVHYLKLRGVVPERLQVDTKINAQGYIDPVLRSNSSRPTRQIKVKTARHPASLGNDQQVTIQSN